MPQWIGFVGTATGIFLGACVYAAWKQPKVFAALAYRALIFFGLCGMAAAFMWGGAVITIDVAWYEAAVGYFILLGVAIYLVVRFGETAHDEREKARKQQYRKRYFHPNPRARIERRNQIDQERDS